MAKSLVIVESPAKAKTIGKYLGAQYVVKASLGHVKDLPKKDLSVDVEKNFEPHYEVIEGKKKLIAELKAAAKGMDSVYLAADPDREGEAICYHLQEELDGAKKGPKFFRVMFNEITAKAVQKAFETPLAVNLNLVDAQQARRILGPAGGLQNLAAALGQSAPRTLRRPRANRGAAADCGPRARNPRLHKTRVLDHRRPAQRQEAAGPHRALHQEGRSGYRSCRRGYGQVPGRSDRRIEVHRPFRNDAREEAQSRSAFHHLYVAAGVLSQTAV